MQNVYLSIFLVLGGLGVLLGTVGTFAVIFRSVFERRRELALLAATGLSRAATVRLVFMENAALLITGLLAGALCAALAVLPALRSTESHVPWAGLAFLLAGVLVIGLLSCSLAARLALPSNPLPALREE